MARAARADSWGDRRLANGHDNGHGAGERLLFAWTFIWNPNLISSVVPSSRFLVRRVLRHIDWQKAELIVEYGPGVGTLTREILRSMRPDARLVAIEINNKFVDFLNQRVRDPRFSAVHGSAEDVRRVVDMAGGKNVDYVVSGIPFKVFTMEMRAAIVNSTYHVMRTGGRFVVYQFSRTVRPVLEKTFGNVQEEFEPLNVLPARVFSCAR